MNKENNPLYMTRKEFEEYRQKSKYCNKPYEYYRIYPILNHQHQQDLIIFLRTNDNPIDIMREATRLLEEELEK